MFTLQGPRSPQFRAFSAYRGERHPCPGSVTMTAEVGTDGATTLSRMNLSGYVGHVTIFSSMFTIACCLVVGL